MSSETLHTVAKKTEPELKHQAFSYGALGVACFWAVLGAGLALEVFRKEQAGVEGVICCEGRLAWRTAAFLLWWPSLSLSLSLSRSSWTLTKNHNRIPFEPLRPFRGVIFCRGRRASCPGGLRCLPGRGGSGRGSHRVAASHLPETPPARSSAFGCDVSVANDGSDAKGSRRSMKRTSAWGKCRLGGWIRSPRWRTTSDSACLCARLRAGPFLAETSAAPSAARSG